jgi:6-phosphogluconolactonase
MGTFDLRKFSDPQQLAQTASTEWLDQIETIRSNRKQPCVALSGGRIAQVFLSCLAQRIKDGQGDLVGVQFFWSDERCVPPEDPESNYRLADQALFKKIAVDVDQIHRLRGELPPEQACALAEKELRAVAGGAPAQPALDLVLLGMGEDGHVASLFPGETESARANPAIFRTVMAVKPPPRRITMGYATIVAAREVWVLASGAGKADALRQSLAPDGKTPLASVLRQRAGTRIYSEIG